MISSVINNQKNATLINRTDLVPITFLLSVDCVCSLGIYDNNDVLVKRLFENVKYKAGRHTEYWNKLNDNNRMSFSGQYSYKVLTNNLICIWEGVVGNNSDFLTGPKVHQTLRAMRAMCFINGGNSGMLGYQYNESGNTYCMINNLTPRQRLDTVLNLNRAAVNYMCCDDNRYYIAGDAPNTDSDSPNIIFAVNANGESIYNFPSGFTFNTKFGNLNFTAIARITFSATDFYTSITVQKSSNLLAVVKSAANPANNSIVFYDKISGALVAANVIPGIKKACFDKNNNLWIGTGVLTKKHSVNSAGVLTDLNISFVTVDLQTIECSYDGSYLLIADGGISQQVKQFNTATGTLMSTFGDLGGYQNDARVTIKKFLFNGATDAVGSSIACMQDGSYWLLDSGNNRFIHYATPNNDTIIDKIEYRPGSYSCDINKGDFTKIYSNYLQYKVSYDKPVSDITSWQLTHNWGASLIDATYYTYYNSIGEPYTFSNGKTYTILINRTLPNSPGELVELIEDGKLRYTGILLANFKDTRIGKGGHLYKTSATSNANIDGAISYYQKRDLTGFDSNGQPMWGTLYNQAIVTRKLTDPAYGGHPDNLGVGQITDSGKIVTFREYEEPGVYHLGGIKIGDNKYSFRTAYSTNVAYEGVYPTDGSYDIGNDVLHGGMRQYVAGNLWLWNYYGENWRQSQANMWQIGYENGLLLTTFGVSGPPPSKDANPAGFAGNAKSGGFCIFNGKGYVYHPDEGAHAGVHRWRIEGLETINEQVYPLSINNEQGLNSKFFQGVDLNNAFLKVKSVTPSFQLTNFQVNTISGNLVQTNYSFKLYGNILPKVLGLHTLYVTCSDKFRLYIGSTKVIDSFSAVPVGEKTGTYTFIDTTAYLIRVEIISSSAANNLSVSWSATGLVKEIIPNSQLTYVKENESNFIRLTEDLPYNTAIENGLYGWTRSPLVNASGTNAIFIARTNALTFKYNNIPDIQIQSRYLNVNTILQRNLGINNSKSWKLSSLITLYNLYPSRDLNNLGYLAILDVNNKIIARFNFFSIGMVNGLNNASLFFNTKTIATVTTISSPYPVGNDTLQNFEIFYSQGKLQLFYNNVLYTDNVFEAGADATKPTYFKFSSIANSTDTRNRQFAFKDLIFIPVL